MSQQLSVIIITYNEEVSIGRCLRSVSHLSSDIIVVDSHSNDKTVEIARNFTPNVFTRQWEGYCTQKQFALSKTANNWVLWIDADEEVPPQLQMEIKKLDFSYNAYSMPIKTFFLGHWIEHCGWYPCRKVRLFDKRRARFNGNMLHEALVVDGTIGKLHHPLHHYSYRNLTHYLEKMNRYTSLWAQEQFRCGRRMWTPIVAFAPILNFVKSYIFRRGFCDGTAGLIVCTLGAFYTFVKYAKLRELKNNNSPMSADMPKN